MNPEAARLEEDRLRQVYWKQWGPYLSERQWGTVREDYSPDGEAWNYFTHDQARSRAYRWGEDGIAGISDTHQRLCFALTLWNGNDPILKERMFGLTGKEGNHGEDCKEYYFFLDNTPTHSYMKCLYKYPHAAYPYQSLIEENRKRGRLEREYELVDTGVFNDQRYFDVFIEYAKATPTDILIEITVANRGPEARTVHLLPTLWFRNTWTWDAEPDKPRLSVSADSPAKIDAIHSTLGAWSLSCQNTSELWFTENESNFQCLFGSPNTTPYVKDAFYRYLVNGEQGAINPEATGTKAAAHYPLSIPAGESRSIKLRLQAADEEKAAPFGPEFDQTFNERRNEADLFYQDLCPFSISDDQRLIQRQAFAGMLWSKQFYNYVVEDWLEGDSAEPRPNRQVLRNQSWTHMYNDDILSMPDTWEYPWFAAWDLAFHTLPLAMLDPEFAKRQLDRLTREWYMHPNGQLPAYEWAFSDVNPPVHAWATMRIYQIEQKMTGRADRAFLEKVFQKLLLNFTWWVNRKDAEGNNIFQGGFLGLDNIGVFDRSKELPTGGYLDQADGTSWMGMYCLNMLEIALELAKENSNYEDIASKFFEHFLRIADAMNSIGDAGIDLWDDEDGFYYDTIHLPDGRHFIMKVNSMVGLIPLLAVATLDAETLNEQAGFKKRMDWFVKNKLDLKENVACMETEGVKGRHLLAIAHCDKLRLILHKLLDENEFFSDHGIRSVSKRHGDHPYIFDFDGQQYRVDYEPAESTTGMFGGNSNWRGPVWFPISYLIIEALQKFHYYLGDEFKVECPTGSGTMMTLWEVATEINRRMMSIFEKDEKGHRPVFDGTDIFQKDPYWQNLILFHEYFHGDNGSGLGASHQTGWTGLIAKMIQQYGEYACEKKPVLAGN